MRKRARKVFSFIAKSFFWLLLMMIDLEDGDTGNVYSFLECVFLSFGLAWLIVPVLIVVEFDLNYWMASGVVISGYLLIGLIAHLLMRWEFGGSFFSLPKVLD